MRPARTAPADGSEHRHPGRAGFWLVNPARGRQGRSRLAGSRRTRQASTGNVSVGALPDMTEQHRAELLQDASMSSFGGMLAFSVAAAHDPNNLEGMEASLRLGQVVDEGLGAHVALKGVEDFAAARSARAAYGARPGRANRAVSSEDEAGTGLPRIRLASDVRSANVLGGEIVPNVVPLESRADFRAASLNPSPNTVYQYNGAEFTTDSVGRGVSTSGRLSLGNGGNRFYDDYKLGYPHNPDALPGDIGFHGGADQFGFPGGRLNVFPGNDELNSASGAYGSFERDVLKPLVADPRNTVMGQFQKIFYEGNYTSRPNEIQVIYRVNDQAPVTTSFLNQAGD